LKRWHYDKSNKNNVYQFDKYDIKKDIIPKPDPRNTESICWLKYFHSIKAGMLVCSEKDLEDIFDLLNGYIVELEEKVLSSLREYNNNYYRFDEWIIYKYIDGEKKVIRKKDKNIIKQGIESKNLDYIEEEWNIQYETKWNGKLDNLLYDIRNTTSDTINAYSKGYFYKFIISINWRGFNGNENYNSFLNRIDQDILPTPISEWKRENYNVKTVNNEYDDIRHNLLLEEFRNFLFKIKDSSIKNMVSIYINSTTLVFKKATDKTKFITSDDPCLILGEKIMMPLTPDIFVVMEKTTPYIKSDKYYIEQISDSDVKDINNIIKKKSQCYLYSNDKDINKFLP